MEQEKLKVVADKSADGNIAFGEMTLVQKIKAVDKCLDDDIRAMLVMDGGNIEIIDIKEELPHYDVYIRYLGACNGCASSATGTLYAIESTLQNKIDENIRVLPV